MRQAVLALAAAALMAPGLAAQNPAAPQDARAAESQALSLSGRLETRNQLPEAETVLKRLLDSQPGSVGGLFALDRVMRAQRKSIGTLPYARRHLQADPTSAGARYLELRLLAEADSLDALVRATDAWIERAPGDPAAYREAAPLWERAFGTDRALELLQRGRRAAGDPGALTIEMGELLVRARRLGDAAEEWARGVGSNATSGDEVVRRIARIADLADRANTADAVIAGLERAPTTPPRRMLAAHVAIAFQRVEQGAAIARALAPELPRATRKAFLEDVGRWAEDAGAPAIGVWALTGLREATTSAEEGRQLDARIQRAALAGGDTAAALGAGKRLVDALPRRSPERRRALADQIRNEARRADADALLGRLEAFRAEFPDAAEVDELSALVSAGLQSRGQTDRAAEVIARVDGPRSSLERAYLLLAQGDVQGGRAALMGAVEGLAPARATEAIQLASLLGRLSGAGGTAVARAAVDAHRGRARDAALALERTVGGLPPADRPAVLAEAARLAAGAGGEADAARMREALLAGWVDAPESAEAALALARWHARRPEGLPAAIRLLEDLIVRAPTSAVAPVARRELDRLKRGA